MWCYIDGVCWAGWRWTSAWAVCHAHGQTDGAGWQYASNFSGVYIYVLGGQLQEGLRRNTRMHRDRETVTNLPKHSHTWSKTQGTKHCTTATPPRVGFNIQPQPLCNTLCSATPLVSRAGGTHGWWCVCVCVSVCVCLSISGGITCSFTNTERTAAYDVCASQPHYAAHPNSQPLTAHPYVTSNFTSTSHALIPPRTTGRLLLP